MYNSSHVVQGFFSPSTVFFEGIFFKGRYLPTKTCVLILRVRVGVLDIGLPGYWMRIQMKKCRGTMVEMDPVRWGELLFISNSLALLNGAAADMFLIKVQEVFLSFRRVERNFFCFRLAVVFFHFNIGKACKLSKSSVAQKFLLIFSQGSDLQDNTFIRSGSLKNKQLNSKQKKRHLLRRKLASLLISKMPTGLLELQILLIEVVSALQYRHYN